MDIHEARLLDRLKDYYTAKKDMEEALIEINELLLLYDFDITNIAKQYPIIDNLYHTDEKKNTKKMRTYL